MIWVLAVMVLALAAGVASLALRVVRLGDEVEALRAAQTKDGEWFERVTLALQGCLNERLIPKRKR